MQHKSLGKDIELGIHGFALFSDANPSTLAWSLNQVHDFNFTRAGDLVLKVDHKKHYCAKFTFYWEWFDTELRIIKNLKVLPLLKTNIHIDYLLIMMDGESDKAAMYFEKNTNFLQHVTGVKKLDAKFIRKLVAYL
jgi:hypothetical protein